ncbi:hypothetical protein D3C75_602450 [compost metagenome]
MNAPVPSAVAVPSTVPPLVVIVTVLPASAVPVTLVPVALTASPVGNAGGVTSTTIAAGCERALMLPAKSVAVTVKEWLPSGKSTVGVYVQMPLALAVTVVYSAPLS